MPRSDPAPGRKDDTEIYTESDPNEEGRVRPTKGDPVQRPENASRSPARRGTNRLTEVISQLSIVPVKLSGQPAGRSTARSRSDTWDSHLAARRRTRGSAAGR